MTFFKAKHAIQWELEAAVILHTLVFRAAAVAWIRRFIPVKTDFTSQHI